jgi:hypothetical protein
MALTARAVLKANRLFGGLPDAALDKLAALSQRRSVRRGTAVPHAHGAGEWRHNRLIPRVENGTSGAYARLVNVQKSSFGMCCAFAHSTLKS